MSPARKEPDTSTYSGRFGARLRELRERKGMLQADVAKVLQKRGVRASRTAVSRWETAESDPPVKVYPILAELYGIKNIRTLLPEK